MRGPTVSSRDVEAVVRVLSEYKHGLSRKALREVLTVTHRKMGDSVVRVAVENARAAGHPVIHDGEVYRLARDRADLERWIANEAEPRAMRILEQVRAMRDHALIRESGQPRLIA